MYSLYAMVDVSGFTISILMGLLAAALKVEIGFLLRDIFEELHGSLCKCASQMNPRQPSRFLGIQTCKGVED